MEKTADWLLRWRYLLSALLIGMTVWLSTAFDTFGFDADFRIFFDDDDQKLLDYEYLEREFTQNYTLLLVVRSNDGDLFSPERLHTLQVISDASWRMPHVTRVISLSNHQHTEADGDDLWVEDLLDEPLSYNDTAIERARDIALNEPELLGRMISENGQTAVIVAYIELAEDEEHEKPVVMQAFREMISEFEAQNPGLSVHVNGQFATDIALTEIAEADSVNVESVMFLTLLVLMAILFRSVVAVVGAFIVMLGSVAAATGFLGMVYHDFNGINLSTPYIVYMMAILDCVHILSAYFSRLAQGMDKRAAMVDSLSKNLEALFITSVTTGVGFLGMLFSESPPFREFGVATAFGVGIAFLYSITVLPLIILLFPAKKAPIAPVTGLVEWVQRAFGRYSRWYLPVGFVVILLMLPAALSNKPNNHSLDAFKVDEPVRVTAEFLENEMSGIDALELMLGTHTENGIADPAFLNRLDDFVGWLEEQPEVLKVSGFHTVIKRLNKSMHGDDPSHYRIPDDRRATAEYILIYESSVPEELDLQDMTNTDKSAVKITAMLKTLSSVDMLTFEQRVRDELKNYERDFPQQLSSGPSFMMAYMAQSNIVAMIGGCLFVALFVWISMSVAFRSVRLGSLCMIPNLFPAIVAFGICGILIGEIDFGTALIFSMTLGVVVDDTVHFVVGYRRSRLVDGLNREEAVQRTYSLVGRAIIVTTLVLCIGFMIPVVLAELQMNVQLYALSVVCFAVALLADLFFLPALLVKTDKDD